jgi:hypothetical protein
VLRTVDVESLIDEDHSARSIWELVGRLDLSLYHAHVGGGDSLLSDELIKQLKELSANLPDDHKQLPPKGRRIVIETMYTPKVQVYDRANLPDEITTIHRLTGTTLHPLPTKPKAKPLPLSMGAPVLQSRGWPPRGERLS